MKCTFIWHISFCDVEFLELRSLVGTHFVDFAGKDKIIDQEKLTPQKISFYIFIPRVTKMVKNKENWLI